MTTHASILAQRIPWMEELGGLQSTGRKASDMTEQLHFHFLQIAEKRREAKSKGEKERYTHLNADFQRIAMRA